MFEHIVRSITRLGFLTILVVATTAPAIAQGSCPVTPQCTSSGDMLLMAPPVSDSFGPDTIPFSPSPSLSVDQWDSQMYAALHGVPANQVELVAVELRLASTITDVRVEIQNNNTGGCRLAFWFSDIQVQLNANIATGSPDVIAQLSLGQTFRPPEYALCGNPGGDPPCSRFEWDLLSPFVQTKCVSWRVQDHDLSPWIGSGSILWDAQSCAVHNYLQDCGAHSSEFGSWGSMEVEVTYFYCVRYVPDPGVGFCFGDPGSGTPCPCNNDNDGSLVGAGCGSGSFASGAKLVGSGQASLISDTLRLSTRYLEPNQTGLYFQGDNDLSPGIVWGDGLRCAGGALKRIGVRLADANGDSDTSGFPFSISAKVGNLQPGDTKYYQCWYRTVVNPPCGSGVHDFNTSNGYAITWLP
jgi:hypothetical protein